MTSLPYTVSAVIVALSLSVFCSRKPTSPVIARVGKAVLTEEDFNNSIPPEYSDQLTLEQNINYVKQWIDTELLFQEAKRRKIDREPLIKNRLEKMKKDLLAAEMMSRNSSLDKASPIDEKAIHAYYELNKDSFIRENDVAKYLEIVVTDIRTARYISKNATSENFLTLAAEYSQQPYPETINVPYIPLDDVQPQIREAIVATPVDATSNPVKSELGYHIVHVMDKLEKGGICKEDEIWEDIVNQLTANYQKQNLEQLISDIRLKTNVEFNSELIKSGTHTDKR